MENTKLIIQGYNEEKKILVNKLSQLGDYNRHISTRSSIESRLKKIDEQMILITNTK